jgi:hypothetical protein
MSQKIAILSLTVNAAAALAANRFVTATGHYAAGPDDAVIGATRSIAAPGENVAVDVLGTTVVEAGGAVAIGHAVGSDANGKAVAGADIALGVALEAASADGDLIEILLQ